MDLAAGSATLEQACQLCLNCSAASCCQVSVFLDPSLNVTGRCYEDSYFVTYAYEGVLMTAASASMVCKASLSQRGLVTVIAVGASTCVLCCFVLLLLVGSCMFALFCTAVGVTLRARLFGTQRRGQNYYVHLN